MFQKKDFYLWLDQLVWVGDRKIRRAEYIPDIAEGIRKWMKGCGYTMDGRWGAKALAKWMYAVHFHERVLHGAGNVINPPIRHRNWQEDYDEYLYIMDVDTVSNFIKRWRLYEDFDAATGLGQRMVNEISEFLYCHINMDASKVGNRIADLLYESDSEDGGGGGGRGSGSGSGSNRRDDSYVMDSREGYHGGDGYKV